jgi:hypothetical protein
MLTVAVARAPQRVGWADIQADAAQQQDWARGNLIKLKPVEAPRRYSCGDARPAGAGDGPQWIAVVDIINAVTISKLNLSQAADLCLARIHMGCVCSEEVMPMSV